MTDQPRITIDAPSEMVILAARHLDATEGPVQVGRTVDAATRSAITTVLRYIAKAHNQKGHETAAYVLEGSARRISLALDEPKPVSPAAVVEVRDPCPRCEDCPLIPRHEMAQHQREHHPETVDADDLTGYWAPDPPIGCITATTAPAHDGGPSIADCRADGARWWNGEREGQ